MLYLIAQKCLSNIVPSYTEYLSISKANNVLEQFPRMIRKKLHALWYHDRTYTDNSCVN